MNLCSFVLKTRVSRSTFSCLLHSHNEPMRVSQKEGSADVLELIADIMPVPRDYEQRQLPQSVVVGARMERSLARIGTSLRSQSQPHPSWSWTSERPMLCTGCQTNCSKSWSFPQARAWQEEAKRLYDRKFEEAAEAEAICNEPIQRTLEKIEAREKHVKTVTMKAGSLATTEADFFSKHSLSGGDTARPQRAFFQTLLERQGARAAPNRATAQRGMISHAALCPQFCRSDVRAPRGDTVGVG